MFHTRAQTTRDEYPGAERLRDQCGQPFLSNQLYGLEVRDMFATGAALIFPGIESLPKPVSTAETLSYKQRLAAARHESS